MQLDAEGLLAVLEKTDALRRPERFELFLMACSADFQGRPGYEARPFPQADRLRQGLSLLQGVDAGAIAHQTGHKADIPAAVRAARLTALREWASGHG
jgi:tRNA nucleotidyltransferase (CCA-adding enzyme)